MRASIDLPDVNVWVALTGEDHVHHQRARQYWDNESAARLAFCRVTALGFLRVCTIPGAIAPEGHSVGEAWQAYSAFRALPEVILATEPDACELRLEELVTSQDMTARMWTDAYLAAFAVSAGMRLVTFDRDFDRLEGLDLLQLDSTPDRPQVG